MKQLNAHSHRNNSFFTSIFVKFVVPFLLLGLAYRLFCSNFAEQPAIVATSSNGTNHDFTMADSPNLDAYDDLSFNDGKGGFNFCLFLSFLHLFRLQFWLLFLIAHSIIIFEVH